MRFLLKVYRRFNQYLIKLKIGVFSNRIFLCRRGKLSLLQKAWKYLLYTGIFSVLTTIRFACDRINMY